MENRLRLALSLCAVLVVGWFFFLGPKKPQQDPKQATIAAGQNNPLPSTAQPAFQEPAKPTEPPLPVPIKTTQKPITIESVGVYRAKLSDQGLESFALLEERYKSNNQRVITTQNGTTTSTVKVLDGYKETEMVPSYRPSLVIDFPKSQFVLPPGLLWTLESPETSDDCQPTPAQSLGAPQVDQHIIVPEAGCKLSYRIELPNQVLLRKIFSFYRNVHRIDIQVEVKNITNGALSHHMSVGLESFQDPIKPGFLSPKIPPREPTWSLHSKITKTSLEDLLDKKEFDNTSGEIQWFGFNQQYFLQALALQPVRIDGRKRISAAADPSGILSLTTEYEESLLKANEKATYRFTYYAGPKIPERLSAINLSSVSEESTGLEKSIDYTLGILARPMLWILRQMYHLSRSWAVAIILLTLLVKIITIYPTYRSNQSMKAMGELKPKIDELQEKYKDDKQKLNVEIANLYKRHGINPIGGCLPMLLQMPIYLALYSMIGNSIELYRASFITPSWIPDLTAADPYFILPLLTGGTMFLQTRLSPSSADAQQKTMALMMPLIFTAFSIFLPAGLTLYILTNTLLGMLQQLVTNRLHQKKAPLKK